MEEWIARRGPLALTIIHLSNHPTKMVRDSLLSHY